MILSRKNKRASRIIIILFHVLTWVAVFILPSMVDHFNKNHITTEQLLRMLCPPIVLCVVFYFNYIYVVPHFLMKSHIRKGLFLAAISVFVGLISLNGYMECVDYLFPKQTHKQWLDEHPEVCRECIRLYVEHETNPKLVDKHADDKDVDKNWDKIGKEITQMSRKHAPNPLDRVLFVFRDLLIYILMVSFAILLRMAEAWHEASEARQQAEIKQKEAELQNMRNQISPHFLLNTLNNIYALTSFNVTKSQKAILDLSGLLRHMLYESQNELVDIQKELSFLRNYINLMQLRQSENVEIKTHTNITENEHFMLAPLIFISLIENSFKHGVSATEKSFIHMSLDYSQENSNLTLVIKNSNFPKTDKDKSGSGIGLEQVQRRLDLIYPNKYKWKHYVSDDNTTYISELCLEIEKYNKIS